MSFLTNEHCRKTCIRQTTTAGVLLLSIIRCVNSIVHCLLNYTVSLNRLNPLLKPRRLTISSRSQRSFVLTPSIATCCASHRGRRFAPRWHNLALGAQFEVDDRLAIWPVDRESWVAWGPRIPGKSQLYNFRSCGHHKHLSWHLGAGARMAMRNSPFDENR